MVGKARGDMGFAGALIPLVAVGTVVLMPLIAPLLVKGVTISTWSLAKPLLLTILLPLIIGAAIRHYADTAATKMFPAVKRFALIATLLTTVWCLVIYGQAMLDTAGELAFLSMTLFMVGMGLMTYNFSFGLKQNQRSIMALGLSTLNGAALFAATTAIPNADPRIGAMTIMWILLSIPLAAIGAKILPNRPARPLRKVRYDGIHVTELSSILRRHFPFRRTAWLIGPATLATGGSSPSLPVSRWLTYWWT